MMVTLLKGKIHRATVTDSNLDYEGSIALDVDLMKAARILPYEQVEVYNITNGERFVTYAITAPGGSGTIGIQGAAAHKAKKNDLVIICAYAQTSEAEAREYRPALVKVDEKNRVKA